MNSLSYYENLLKKYKKLKMLCTNPDLIVHRGSRSEYCAGSIAAIFEKLGGKVAYFGKPYPEIYNFCIKKKWNYPCYRRQHTNRYNGSKQNEIWFIIYN